MAKKLRIGVIGAGGMATNIHVPSLAQIEECEIVAICDLFEEKAKELAVPQEKAMLLEHMVISHHGEPDFGAAVRPMFLEAEILSQLDKLDATIYEISSAGSEVKDGEFTGRQWALDNRKLYKHGRKEVSTKAELE